MGQSTVLQIGIHLLDDGMLAVGFVRRDGVQNGGVHGGEERVVPVRVEQGGLPVTGLRVQFRDAAHHQPRVSDGLCRGSGPRVIGEHFVHD